MKKKVKKLNLKLREINLGSTGFCHLGNPKYTYTFESEEYIDLDDCELLMTYKEPENMGEFIDVHSISSSELLEWLNENYK